MTSKLKCLFCDYELQENRTTNLCCPICGLVAPTKLWQALIESHKSLVLSEQSADREIHRLRDLLSQSQKDLEIARKAADNSREKLAAYMHDVWGNWFAYQLNNSTAENLQRWGIQSNTPYSSLTETDKTKDRRFADRIIEIIKEQIEHKES